MVLDNKGRIVHFNKACEQLTGYQASEVMGCQLMHLPINENGAPFAKAGFQTKSVGAFFESRCLARDGIPHDVAWTSTDLNGNTGNIKSIFTGIDITARKKMEEELGKSRQHLRRLSAHLQSVREEERTRISRELHDELGQALSILQMDLSWLENRLPGGKEWLEKITSMSELLENTMQTVQEISRELRPSLLDNLGLLAAIEWQTQEFQKRSGIRCEINEISEEIEPNPEISTTLFRILQEALTNIVRHSKAKCVEVSLKIKAGKLILVIKDNGIGITWDQISDPDSMGLIGMQERIDFMQGEFKIHGSPKKGTTLTVSIPLNS